MDKTKFTFGKFSFPVFFCNQLYISSAFFKNRVCQISKIFQETHKTVSISILLALILPRFLNSTTEATLPTYEILIAVENLKF
jgi:uncharacterized membrane protein YeiH